MEIYTPRQAVGRFREVSERIKINKEEGGERGGGEERRKVGRNN